MKIKKTTVISIVLLLLFITAVLAVPYFIDKRFENKMATATDAFINASSKDLKEKAMVDLYQVSNNPPKLSLIETHALKKPQPTLEQVCAYMVRIANYWASRGDMDTAMAVTDAIMETCP